MTTEGESDAPSSKSTFFIKNQFIIFARKASPLVLKFSCAQPLYLEALYLKDGRRLDGNG